MPCSSSPPLRRTLCSGDYERLLDLSGGLQEVQSALGPIWLEADGPVPHQREDGTGIGGEDLAESQRLTKELLDQPLPMISQDKAFHVASVRTCVISGSIK